MKISLAKSLQMLRSSQIKRVPSIRYHPYKQLATRSRKLYVYADENDSTIDSDSFGTRTDGFSSCLFESTRSCFTPTSNMQQFNHKLKASSFIHSHKEEAVQNFKQNSEFRGVDQYIRGVCGGRLGKAKASEFKVLQNHDGNTRFKMVYDKAWGKFQVIVARNSAKKLELVWEDSI